MRDGDSPPTTRSSVGGCADKPEVPMAIIKIAVINRSTAVSGAQVQAAGPPLQTQIRPGFAPVWGVDAAFVFVPAGGGPSTRAAWLLILYASGTRARRGFS